jgi:hypothetical protein
MGMVFNESTSESIKHMRFVFVRVLVTVIGSFATSTDRFNCDLGVDYDHAHEHEHEFCSRNAKIAQGSRIKM